MNSEFLQMNSSFVQMNLNNTMKLNSMNTDFEIKYA